MTQLTWVSWLTPGAATSDSFPLDSGSRRRLQRLLGASAAAQRHGRERGQGGEQRQEDDDDGEARAEAGRIVLALLRLTGERGELNPQLILHEGVAVFRAILLRGGRLRLTFRVCSAEVEVGMSTFGDCQEY